MAEAILFGHRSLQPLIDLQEQLQQAVGKAKRMPYHRARDRVGPRLRRRGRRKRRVRRRRRRDHRPRPQDGRPRRDRRRQGQGRQDRRHAGRRSSTRAGRSSATRCTASPTRTSRARRRRRRPPSSSSKFAGDALARRPQRRLRPRLPRGGHRRRLPLRAGHATSTRWSLAREAYPDSASYKLADLARFFGIELEPKPPRPAGRRGHRQAAHLVSPSDLPNRIDDAEEGIADRDPRLPNAGARRRRRCLEAARRQARVGKGLFGLRPQEDRPRARPRRGHPHGRPRRRPRSGRSRSRSACCRAPTARACSPAARPRRSRSRRSARPRTCSGSTRSAPRPRSATSTTTTCRRTAPARTSRCAAPAGARSATATSPSGRSCPSCRATTSSRTSSGSCQRVRHVQRLDVDGLDLRLDPRPHGRRRADQGARRRCGDGPESASRTARSRS